VGNKGTDSARPTFETGGMPWNNGRADAKLVRDHGPRCPRYARLPGLGVEPEGQLWAGAVRGKHDHHAGTGAQLTRAVRRSDRDRDAHVGKQGRAPSAKVTVVGDMHGVAMLRGASTVRRRGWDHQ